MNDTDFLCRYFDATEMSEYLFKVIEETIDSVIPAELVFLLRYEKAKKEMQTVVDMPDNKIDSFITFCQQNNGVLAASKRKKYFPMLSDEEIGSLEKSVKKLLLGGELNHGPSSES